MRPRLDFPAITTHELDFVVGVVGLVFPWGRVVEVDFAGTRGGAAGFRVGVVGVVCIHGGRESD